MIDDIVINFYKTGICEDAEDCIHHLKETSFIEIQDLVKNLDQKIITTKNTPQYSSLTDGTINLIKYLRMAGDFGPTQLEIGKYFIGLGHKKDAYLKYGGNHSNLSNNLKLTKYENRPIQVYLTSLGKLVEKEPEAIQKECIQKLTGIVPVVQYALKNNINSSLELEEFLKTFLSEKTALRRRCNIWNLILMFKNQYTWEKKRNEF